MVRSLFTSVVMLLAVLAWQPGCTSSNTKTTDAHGDHDDHDEHEHEHEHDHPPHGPHGGHLVKLGDGTYQAEWAIDTNDGLVGVFIMDSEGKAEVAVPVPHVKITTKLPDKEPTEYLLEAMNASSDDPPKATNFATKNPSLAVAIPNKAVVSTLILEIDGKQHTALLKYHAHGHHHH